MGLLVITLGFSFTGYLLPWDQLSYWAVTVGTNLMSTTYRSSGCNLSDLLIGGDQIGQATLLRVLCCTSRCPRWRWCHGADDPHLAGPQGWFRGQTWRRPGVRRGGDRRIDDPGAGVDSVDTSAVPARSGLLGHGGRSTRYGRWAWCRSHSVTAEERLTDDTVSRAAPAWFGTSVGLGTVATVIAPPRCLVRRPTARYRQSERDSRTRPRPRSSSSAWQELPSFGPIPAARDLRSGQAS